VSDVSVTDLPFLPPPDQPARVMMGVDPGMRGGIAFLGELLTCYDIPIVGIEVDVEEVCRLIRQHNPGMAVVERAGAMPKQGLASTFRYALACGMLRGALTACNVPYHLVAATAWKKRFGLDRDKEKSRAMALRLWPGTNFFARKKDHGRAEAALLARYGCLAYPT
jgi:hypothetical protein